VIVEVDQRREIRVNRGQHDCLGHERGIERERTGGEARGCAACRQSSAGYFR